MATASSSIVFNTPTANASVTSLKPISDMLQTLVTAGVLLQTADTGQVSWGGVAANQTNTTNYEIFRLNDSLNATYPIFMKFHYVTQGTSSMPLCRIQIGTGSDGAGALTGASGTPVFRGVGSPAADTNTTSIFASAGEGYLNVWGGANVTVPTASNGAFGLSIERTRNSNGTVNGDGVSVLGTFFFVNTGTALYHPGGSTYSYSSGNPLLAGHYSATRATFANLFQSANNVWPPVSNRGSSYWSTPMYDGTNYLASAIQPYAGKLYPPCTGVLLVDSLFPAFTTMSLTIYGASRTYYTTNGNLVAPMPAMISAIAGVASTFSPLANQPIFRYE